MTKYERTPANKHAYPEILADDEKEKKKVMTIPNILGHGSKGLDKMLQAHSSYDSRPPRLHQRR